MSDNTLRDAALEYARAGYSVIPVQAEGKKPLGEWKDAQEHPATEAQIHDWWSKYPRSNVGIVCGAVSGITVVDLDGTAGLESFKPLGLPATRVVKTPHGHHLYYEYTPDLPTGAAFLPGIDVRSDGGFVVAPPSEIGGKGYAVQQDKPIVPIGPIPEAFSSQHRNGTTPEPSTAPGWVSDLLAHGAPEGQRNNDAIRLAGYLHSKGHPVDIISAMMEGFAAKCRPPILDRELRTTIQSAMRYPQRQAAVKIEGAPDMENLGDRLVFRWPTHNLVVEMGSVHRDHEDIRCLLDLYRETENGDRDYLYGPVKYNIVTTGDRTGLTRYLKENLGLDADRMLQGMSRLAYLEIRRGANLVWLADVDERQGEALWALWPLLLQDHVNVWFGDGGTGKSLMALAVAMTMHSGEDFGLGTPAASMPAMYLDWEFDEKDHRRRMLGLTGRDPVLSDMTIMYKRCWAPIYDMVDELLRDRAEHGPAFFVADSALLAAGGEPEKADTVRRVFEAIRRIGGTWLIIAHTTHDKERDKPFGSAFWHNMARNIWRFRLANEPGKDSSHLLLKHTKANSTRLSRQMGVRIEWDDTIRVVKEDAANVPEHANRLPLADRVWAALQGGAMSLQDLTSRLNDLDDSVQYDAVAKAVRVGKRFASWSADGRKMVGRADWDG